MALSRLFKVVIRFCSMLRAAALNSSSMTPNYNVGLRPLKQSTREREIPKRGYAKLFEECVLQADQGCDFDFLLREGHSTTPKKDETDQSLLDHTAKGVYAIAVTPLSLDGSVDYESVDKMTDFYLSCGVTGLTILGIMGEAPKLDPAEALAVSNQVVRRAGVPIIVGVLRPRLRSNARSLACSVMEGGAAGVMIAPPPSLRTDDQIVND